MINKLLTISFFLFASTLLWGQVAKLDSASLEQKFLSAIGNPAAIDSTEKVLYTHVKGDFRLEDIYWYNLSKVRFMTGQLNESFAATEKGIALSKQNKNDYKSAKFYNLKASVYAYRKDTKKAVASFRKALAFVEENKDFKTAASIRNNIANIYFGLSDFNSAYAYSSVAYTQLKKYNDTVNLPGVTGILAVSALKIGKKKEGIRLAKESIALATKYKNPIGLIVGNHSLGEAYNAQEKYDNAITSLQTSLEYSELYRQSHFIMLNKLALQHASLMNKQYTQSIAFGLEALEETKKLKNENTLFAIHKNLGYAYSALNENDKAFANMSKAHDLYIESSSVENQKSINDILIKYGTEKKEKDLIAAQLINAENENKLIRRMQWITLLGSFLFLGIVGYLFYARLQKQKLVQLKKEQEAKRLKASISAEEKERERISNELHDGMASTITGIKLKLEDFSEEDKKLSPLVTQLQNLHDETRRMSHNLMPLDLNNKNWRERIGQYCTENSSATFKILFSDNIKENLSLDTSISTILYRCIQELIHNAQKHAKTSHCFVQVSKLVEEIAISVEDEGAGFSETDQSSQGLNSMRKRLNEIGAKLEIDSKIKRGSHISIYLKIV